EARRVLRDGGTFLFNVWDRIEENEFADDVTRSLATIFPDDPPRFLAPSPQIVTLTERSRAASPKVVAVAYCQGTPLRSEIEARDASRLVEATEAAASAIEKRFGPDSVDGKIQALVVAVDR